MEAGGLPPGMPSWELDAWYKDLQDVLAAAEPGGAPLPWGAEQVKVATGGPEACELDEVLAVELLELLGPGNAAGPGPAGSPSTAPCSSSPPPQLGTPEAAAVAGRGVKRKRCSGGSSVASREAAKSRERADEQRVLELTAHNEWLREEIGRLSAEVQRTRAALIDRIVNLRRA
ncbi:DDIT3 protein, partial [Rhinopomastus cyanomelas]|nr:DDIT3 protein [Rhinopomastus cyanomelas]